MEIAEIRAEMRRKGVSQVELADLSGIPLQTIRKIFCGITPHPRIDTMQAIERALGVADGGVMENGKVLTDKEKRLLTAFNGLVEPMQDFIIETVESLVEKGVIGEKRA